MMSVMGLLGKTAELENDHRFDIDNTPQIHGSGWFMTKDRFFELGGFPLQDPMGHAQEPLWLGLRNWFAGGRVVVNKKTHYAHLHQETRDKGFALGHRNEEFTYNYVATHFMMEPKMEWFLDKFMPMPTWPEDWREQLTKWRNHMSGQNLTGFISEVWSKKLAVILDKSGVMMGLVNRDYEGI